MKINRTTERTIKIMELLAETRAGLSLAEISKILDMPKTSAFDIIQTLLYMNIVETKNKGGKTFQIGLKAFEIGSQYIKNTEYITVIKEHLKKLSETLNKTTFFAMENNGEVIYLIKCESAKAIITTANLGSKNPIYCTSLGKAILSALPEKKANEIISNTNFVAKTEYTIKSKEQLCEEIEKIRKRGYALDDRELEEHMFCIAAPIYNYENTIVGAISAVDLYKDNLPVENQGRLVNETALEISKKLGYTKDRLY